MPKPSPFRYFKTSPEIIRLAVMFAGEIRKRLIKGMRSSRWKWHLDEMFVKINGEMHYPWRAFDHQGSHSSNGTSTPA